MSSIINRRGDYYGDGSDNLIWEIRDEQGVAAELYIGADHRMILNIEVRDDRRGEGLARDLYEAAAEAGPIFHAPEWGCSEDGAGFAEAMGGEVMDSERAADILGIDIDFLDAA